MNVSTAVLNYFITTNDIINSRPDRVKKTTLLPVKKPWPKDMVSIHSTRYDCMCEDTVQYEM